MDDYETCKDKYQKCEFFIDHNRGFKYCINCGVISNEITFEHSVENDYTHSTGVRKASKEKSSETSYDTLFTTMESENPSINEIVDAIPHLPFTFQQQAAMQYVRRRLPPSLSNSVELSLKMRNHKENLKYGLSMTLPYHKQQVIIHEKEEKNRILESKSLDEIKDIAREKGIKIGKLNKDGLIKEVSIKSESQNELRKIAKDKGIKNINSLSKDGLREAIQQKEVSLPESIESKSLVKLRKIAMDKGLKRINSYSKKELIEKLNSLT